MASEHPNRLQVASPFPFVGRARELTTLVDLLPPHAGAGPTSFGLVGGEAGSGKTRLVRELAREADSAGVLVLDGTCDPVVRTAFGPVVEVLGDLVAAIGPDGLRANLGSTGGELARLLPDLRLQFGAFEALVEHDPDTGRHRLQTAVADLLVNAARQKPVLMVLEDLHWADGPTLLLLRHLARSGAAAQMLVIGTFRDTEADVPPDLAELLVDLRRSGDCVRLKLAGLGEESVAEFVRRSASGEAADPNLIQSIVQLTEGNPFLLCELWRSLVETGAVALERGVVRLTRSPETIGTPESVREVVQQRLARLEPATNELLELAAVIGSEFEFERLRSTAPAGLDVGRSLETVLRSGLIEEVPSEALAYRFTHELIRQAVYERLRRLKRAELHLRVAETMESGAPQPNPVLLAGLAHHYAAAVSLGGREKAIHYNRLAAAAAGQAMAFGEAASRLRTAIALETEDGPRLAELQIQLGDELCRAGDTLESLAAYRTAAALARRFRSGELLARTAIGFENACTRPGLDDQGALLLLEEASEILPGEDSPLRVRLLGSLTRAHSRLHGDDQRGRVTIRAGIEMARRLGDKSGLATILSYSYWSDLDRRDVVAMLDEAAGLASELGDRDLEAEAMAWRGAALMVLGDIDAADREVAMLREKVARARQPFYLHIVEHHTSALALLRGRLEEARAAAERSREWGRLLTGLDASSIYGVQMFGVLREEGGLEELAPAVTALADHDSFWQPGLAALLVEVGMEDEARRVLAEIRESGLDRFRQSLWLLALTYLADASSALDEAGVARLVYPQLSPLRGAPVVVGHAIVCYGAADRYLGMLAAAFGDTAAAEQHFEAALKLNRAMGARTWLAHTAYQYGRMLARTGDRRRARQLLGEATAIGEEVGLTALLRRARALARSDLMSGPPESDSLSSREVEVLRLLAQGLTNRQIGSALHISEHTAANHIRSILGKTGAANRTEAAAYAFQRGLAP